MDTSKANNLPQNPRERANIFSYLFFWWVFPILFKGARKELEVEDLYLPLKVHKSDYLGDKLSKSWEQEIEKYQTKNKEPNLLRATLRVFGWKIMGFGIILAVLEFTLKVSQPLFLGGLISFYSGSGSGHENKTSREEAYLYASAVILCSAINVLFMHPFMLSVLHMGMKLRVAMCSMIYRKSLKLSKNALGETTAGQVVNLLSNDVGRLDLSVMFVHYLWVGPLETFVITFLMYNEIGISAVFGVIFMLLFIPLQAYLGKKTSVLRFKTAQRTDERVRLMNEIIQGIQVIKMYAWEKPFGKLVEKARQKEIKVIRYGSYIRGILLSFIMFTTRVSVFISLVSYVLLGKFISAEKAFVITSYYNILRQTMTVFFPQGIGQFAETLVSFKRIQTYMLYDETISKSEPLSADIDNSENETNSFDSNVTKLVDDDDILRNQIVYKVDDEQTKNEEKKDKRNSLLSEAGIIANSITAKWDTKSNENTLNEVNLRVQPETLVAIIGPVGSGKSSLIQAILGELPIDSGTLKINGTVSYASQEPWLFSGTVRQNILFGQPMDKQRYREVVKKCALERDFTLFAHGDKTIVGERGQSLSGGQKARISLARAVYRKAAIYLLDDPLSAVDAHVGRHLFDQCMKDYLKGSIVILITHQLQYLQSADQIIILEHGNIKAVGTYDSLRETGLDFAKLLAENSSDDEGNSDLNRSRSGSRNSKILRQQSETSLQSVEEKNETIDNPMQVDEKKADGTIGLGLYRKYFKAGGGFCTFYMLFMLCVLAQLAASGGDYFVTYWVNKEEAHQTEQQKFKSFSNSTETLASIIEQGNTNSQINETVLHSTFPTMLKNVVENDRIIDKISNFFIDLSKDKYFDIYIFTIITVATILLTLSRSFMFFNMAMRASTTLHNTMFRGITRATMFFFNTNPSGRILNRFSKDMGQVDEMLPAVMIDVIQIFLFLFGIIIVVAVVNFWLLIPTIVMGVLFYFMRVFYLKSSTSIKRIEGTTRSPIYSHLSATLTGLSTIRAFRAQNILVKEFDHYQDLHSSSFYVFLSISRAFGFWLDVTCCIFIAIVTLSFFAMGDAYGGNVGLAITQAIGMTGMVQWGMRQSAELENTMTCIERVVEYETVDPEDSLEAEPDKKPPATWPEQGNIKFDGVSLRYFPDPESDTVLKDLEFEIQPCEKVGIVGRTGAGKSSLINALFRLSYNDGSIIIDSRDTNSMGLHDLRSKISIIPQEPVLFSGTMRYNLDPFDEYPDEKLWRALDEVKLKDDVSELTSGLQTRIAEGGSNFSVGQRQLVCLARALLRENKILVMDEATANVDPQTDALIQTTIREKFSDCTVLTIAHRLHTVMDSDKILVMDAGHVAEFGSPFELLNASTGPQILRSMAKQLGKTSFDSFIKISEAVYLEKKNK